MTEWMINLLINQLMDKLRISTGLTKADWEVVICNSNSLIDELTDTLADLLTDYWTDWLIDWHTIWLTEKLSDFTTNLLTFQYKTSISEERVKIKTFSVDVICIIWNPRIFNFVSFIIFLTSLLFSSPYLQSSSLFLHSFSLVVSVSPPSALLLSPSLRLSYYLKFHSVLSSISYCN